MIRRIIAVFLIVITFAMFSSAITTFSENQRGVAFEANQSVSGDGFVNIYKYASTKRLDNDTTLKMTNLGHGSGSYDADMLLSSHQKYSYSTTSHTWSDVDTKILLDEEAEMVYAPVEFSYGKSFSFDGYNSPWKEETWGRHYEIGQANVTGIAMAYQFLYANTLDKDISSELYWKGKQKYSKMDIDASFDGTAHIRAALVGSGPKETHVYVDEDYAGTFAIVKKMEIETENPTSTVEDNWLSCCYGGLDNVSSKDYRWLEPEIDACTCFAVPTEAEF